jgi:hypothetical protein
MKGASATGHGDADTPLESVCARRERRGADTYSKEGEPGRRCHACPVKVFGAGLLLLDEKRAVPPNTYSSTALGPGQAHHRLLPWTVVQRAKGPGRERGVDTTAGRARARPQVVFFLHPTFHNPVREVLQHPFEIEEHGWGEFELSVVVRACGSFKAGHSTVMAWVLTCGCSPMGRAADVFTLRS